MKTYPVDYNLLAHSADALLVMEDFSRHVELIAEIIQLITLQVLKDDNFLIKRLTDMLIQMATQAQNCESGRLAGRLCSVFDGNVEKMS